MAKDLSVPRAISVITKTTGTVQPLANVPIVKIASGNELLQHIYLLLYFTFEIALIVSCFKENVQVHEIIKNKGAYFS